jgi:cell division cycle protein 37
MYTCSSLPSHRERWKALEESLQAISDNQPEEKKRLEKELAKLKSEKEEIKKKDKEFKKKEKLTPWNVDTISKPGFEKTVCLVADMYANAHRVPSNIHI